MIRIPSLLVLCALALGPTLARADEAPKSLVLARSDFTTSGATGLVFEQAITERWSWNVGLGFSGTRTEGTTSSFLPMTNLLAVATPGVSVFLTGSAPEGLWIGPRVALWYGLGAQGEGGQSFATDTVSVGIDALVGYTGVFAKGLTFQLAGGFGANTFRTVSRPGSTTTVDVWGVSSGLRFQTALGWAF